MQKEKWLIETDARKYNLPYVEAMATNFIRVKCLRLEEREKKRFIDDIISIYKNEVIVNYLELNKVLNEMTSDMKNELCELKSRVQNNQQKICNDSLRVQKNKDFFCLSENAVSSDFIRFLRDLYKFMD